jgi:hypothetical protein
LKIIENKNKINRKKIIFWNFKDQKNGKIGGKQRNI